MERHPCLIEYHPSWEEFGAKDVIEALEKEAPSFYGRFIVILKQLRVVGFGLKGNLIKTYDGDIKELKLGEYRIFFVKGMSDRTYWIIWACKKKSQKTRKRDDAQVRHRAEMARRA